MQNPVAQTGQFNQPFGSRPQAQNAAAHTLQSNQMTGNNAFMGLGPGGYGNMAHLRTQRRGSPYETEWRNPSLADMLGAGINEYQAYADEAQQGRNPDANPQM